MQKNRNYPQSLKKLPIWILWRLEDDLKGRKTKIPYSARYFGKASSTNPKTWSSFEAVCSEAFKRPQFYNGLGIAISEENSLIFIDVDHCIDEDGTINDLGSDIVSIMQNQYVEISQSGSGIHILALGSIPKNYKNSDNGVEIYSNARFCSLTGNTLSNGDPHEDQIALDTVYMKYKKKDPPKIQRERIQVELENGDSWILEHASKSQKFSDLWSGNWSGSFGSQSEADLSLCGILAFWTNCNEGQIDRLFRNSGLYREKWDRADYRESTIRSAVNNCSETLSEYIKRKGREEAELYERTITSSWDN